MIKIISNFTFSFLQKPIEFLGIYYFAIIIKKLLMSKASYLCRKVYVQASMLVADLISARMQTMIWKFACVTHLQPHRERQANNLYKQTMIWKFEFLKKHSLSSISPEKYLSDQYHLRSKTFFVGLMIMTIDPITWKCPASLYHQLGIFYFFQVWMENP